MTILHTLLLFQQNYEDTSWGCIALHSKGGYSSVQTMVETIAKIFNKIVTDERNNYYGDYCCYTSRRKGLKACEKCNKFTAVPPITERELAEEFRRMASGTMQHYGSDMWEALEGLGIESFGFKGDAGQTVSIYYSAELIARTIFHGFKIDSGESIHRCSSIPLYKKDVKKPKTK